MLKKNPYARGICSKCGIWYDNIDNIGTKYHPEIKEVCAECRWERAMFYLNSETNRWEPCSNCMFQGYSLDDSLGEHGRCTRCRTGSYSNTRRSFKNLMRITLKDGAYQRFTVDNEIE